MSERPTTAGELADLLVGFVADEMTVYARRHGPDLRLPAIFAGHPVDGDAAGDLAYTLGLLSSCGVEQVEGASTRDAALRVVAEADPARVEAFFSYRMGETVLRLDGERTDHVRAVVQSRGTVEGVRAQTLPRNYGIVSLRCLDVLERLGLTEPLDNEHLAEAWDRCRAIFDDTRTGWLADGAGATDAHHDIYSADMYLFAEPMAHGLPAWRDGLTRQLADLDHLASPGGAVVWGRSVGALSMALTIELAAVAVGHDLDVAQPRWLRRAFETFRRLRPWFVDGTIAAHQHRSPMFYRGPARRLQFTFDMLGKLLLAALALRERPDVPVGPDADVWPATDTLVELEPGDDDRARSTAWAYRSDRLSFVVPPGWGWSSDYLSSPRSPGLFEVPTSGHPCFLPVISNPKGPLVPSGPADKARNDDGSVTITQQRWTPPSTMASSDVAKGGSRSATYRVDGRVLSVTETLTFDDPAGVPVLSLTVPEVAGRRLEVEADGDGVGPVHTIDTAGVAEWRSFWNELPRVHQVEIEPAETVRFTWKVRPKLRVVTTIGGHWYERSLYEAMDDRVEQVPLMKFDDLLTDRLRDVDVVHVHWPEWLTFDDATVSEQVIDRIRAAGAKILWTQHNLLPHATKEAGRESYARWATAADGVIHHTELGRTAALAEHPYGDRTRHVVIPHGHWGHFFDRHRHVTRAAVELANGWPSCGIRLAVVGAPRDEKDLQGVMDAVAASDRDDIQLVARIAGHETVPDDPRIIPDRLQLPLDDYQRRLFAFDALIMPFAPSGMLLTGTAFDAIGKPLAAITSDWAFFDETFEGADIRYGSTTDDLRRCIDGLTKERLVESTEAMRALQPRFDWSTIAHDTVDFIETLVDG